MPGSVVPVRFKVQVHMLDAAGQSRAHTPQEQAFRGPRLHTVAVLILLGNSILPLPVLDCQLFEDRTQSCKFFYNLGLVLRLEHNSCLRNIYFMNE